MRFDRDGFSVESARKKKRKLPDWYLDRPDDVDDGDFFFEAFRDLITERRVEGGPIPWSACRVYALDRGLDDENCDLLWAVIRALDLAERKWVSDNMKAEGMGGGA